MPAILSRIFRRTPLDPATRPVPFGPRYSVSGDRLSIDSGPLAGTALRFERSVTATKADFSLYELAGGASPIASRQSPASADPVAHCHFDRDRQTGMETLWSVFIRSEYRHRGLATLLARLTFRDLLSTGRRHWFAIRKLMQVDSEGRNLLSPPGNSRLDGPQQSRITLHNLGLGLIALRLGFRPEPDLARLLAPVNVQAIQAIPPHPPSPPGLLLRLGILPGLLVAAMVYPVTGQPVAIAAAYERFVNPKQLLRQALAGQAVIGNIDYIVSRAAVEPLASRLANDQTELRHFAAALRRGAQN